MEMTKLAFEVTPLVSMNRRINRAKSMCWFRLAALFVILCATTPFASVIRAQDYQTALGIPPFMTALPAEGGSVDAANGNLHIEIPLGMYSQRGLPPIRLSLAYDSTIWAPAGGVWQQSSSLIGAWNGLQGPAAGWRLVMTGLGSSNPQYQTAFNPCPGGGDNVTSFNFSWTAADGTTHLFPITTTDTHFGLSCGTDTPNGDAFATDSSGYHMFVTGYGYATVYAPDGSLAYNSPSGIGLPLYDANGNYLSTGWPIQDTLGRNPVIAGTTSSCPSGSYTCFTYNVPNSTGGTSQFILQVQGSVSVHTNFGQSGITECSSSCTVDVVNQITLPDGSIYSFTYDTGTTAGNYGMLTSMTLPTGATINYTYTNFTDAYGNVGRRIASRSVGSNNWSYTPAVISTCTSTSVGCQQSMTVTQPSGDHSVYTFTLDNGAWPVQMVSYDGSSSTVLATHTTNWDFTHACTVPTTCIGHQYITKLSDTTTLPMPSGSLNRTTQYTYDTSTNDGNIATVKEWNFYPGSLPGTPDRITNITYLSGSSYAAVNIMNRPASVTVTDGSGSTQFSKTLYSYDSTSPGLTSATGAVNHDDTNYGTSFTTRGNLTQVQKWISGSNNLTSSMVYDTTGQVVSATDPSGNTTSLAYDDSFLDDATTASPHAALSLPTNAYLTKLTQPTVGSNSFVSNFSYYYGTGQLAKATDVNGQVSISHYLDPLSRPTSSTPPVGWSLTSYTPTTLTTPMHVDSYTAVSDTTPSTSCTGCVHSQVDLDSMGRPQYSKVINNPNGATTSQTSYDSNGRPYNVTAPNYPSGLITAADTTAFDGLSRPVSVLHADSSASYAYYGPTVTANGGNGTQQCGPPSGCPYGYPVLSKDEAGKVHETWTDGFGRLIEVDEPVSVVAAAGGGSGTSSGTEQFSSGSTGTAGHGTVTIGGSDQFTSVEVDPVCELYDCGGNCLSWSNGSRDGSPTFTTVWDSGSVSITVNGHTDSAGYNSSSSASSIASALGTFINADSSASVTASVSGAVITLTAKTTGSSTNYSLSTSASTSDPTDFSSPSFGGTPSGSTLTGGAAGSGSTWDAGTIGITVNGHADSVSYTSSSTASSVASALASAIAADSSAYVNASVSGTTITLTAKTTGVATNYSFSTSSSTSFPAIFSSPSFSISVSGSALTGGVDPNSASLASPLFTTYAYNAVGSLLTVTQGAQTRSYTYDGLGRALSASIPETTPTGGSQHTSYSNYDADSTCGTSFPGQLVSTVDARTVRTCLQYDALGRVTQTSYNVGSTGVASTATVSYAYDSGGSSANALGRLTSMTDGLGSETYTYDVAGQVTHIAKVIDSVTYGMDYTYNLAGEPLTVAYPSSTTPKVVSGYDAIGRLCGVGASVSGCTVTTPYASGFSYSAPGQATGFTLGNGVTASFGYSNNRLQMTSLAYTKSSTTLLGLNYYYAYDATNCPTGAAGNNAQIQCIIDGTSTAAAGRSAKYSYDELGRLSTASTSGTSTYPVWGLSWTYDRYGNRTAQSVTAGSAPSDSLMIGTSTNQVTGTGYSYDANGNMLGDGVNTMTYDAENRMVTSSNGSSSGQYVYDGNGIRVKKCVPNCSSATTTTRYIFSGSKVIAEYDNGAAASSPSREYLYAGGLKVATLVSSTPTYHLRDHLSVRVNTDNSGSIIGEQGHYPFGDSWYLNSTTTKEQFTSYERDAESGNDYAMARYNVNRLGRFSSVDPLSGNLSNPQSLNHYAYALNDPINGADPSGLSSCDPDNPNPLPVCETAVETDEGGGTCTLDGISIDCGSINQQGVTACVNNDCKTTNDPHQVCISVDGRDPICFTLQLNGVNGPTYSDKYGRDVSGTRLAEWEFSGLPSPGFWAALLGLGTRQQTISALAQVGIFPSPLDNKSNPFHGTDSNFREFKPVCSVHATVNNGTGRTSFHTDSVNPMYPWPPTGQYDTATTTAVGYLLHGIFDVVPYAIGMPAGAGAACP
jgi:RHS repeat-associated protein